MIGVASLHEQCSLWVAYIMLSRPAMSDQLSALCYSNVQKEEKMDDARFQQSITFEQLR